MFVGRPGGTAEDDGWLVTYVHDLPAGTAELVVLDAQDFGRGYVARVPLPQRVPVRLPRQLGQRPGGCSACLIVM